jgi:predicted amidophosphoribosyltransferase
VDINFLVEFKYGVEEKLVYSLKKGACQKLNFEWLANQLLQKMIIKGLDLDAVIWATPNSIHSLEIVKSINKITGLNADIVVLNEEGSNNGKLEQKKKTKVERQLKRFKTPSEPVNHLKKYVFVDDVVATASTALAAKQILGVVDFEVWCICYRPVLAQGHDI